jgi:carboxymethylenebutenolidase
VYPDAGHAFANPSGTRYDARAAELAWERTLRFFEQHLRPGEPAGAGPP